MKLFNKTAIISGASQGFGFEVAKQFALEGANLVLCARDNTQLQQAVAQLIAETKHTHIIGIVADVSKLAEMEALAKQTHAQFGRIDILVANAGVYGTKGLIEEIDAEAWSDAIDINLKGTVWQCRAVLPYMKKASHGKIIILSGGGATKPMPNLSAYAASKAGVVRFAETLAEETKAFGIDVNTVAPGALNTRLLDEVINAGPDQVGANFYQQALKQKETGGTNLKIGAELCVFLASLESDGITGRLISAVWDPWRKLPALIQELKQSDVYTLRRIVPKDRGYAWEDNQ